jgi:TP901 family phage tail tape measure protein
MSIGSLGIRTHEVGLVPSIEAAARAVNRRGIVVRVRASDFTQPLGKMSASASEFTKSLEASNARVLAFTASAVIIGSVTASFAQLVIQAVKVEKILTDINAVLGASVETLQKFGDGLFNVARNTSQSLEIAAEAALEFSRQGLNMEETLKRTNDALILTRLTGLAAADSVKGLTAAVNGFADAGLNTTEIINKLAAVDVKFAVSAEDLINALARAGAVAQDAGVNFDQLIGAVTSAQQITARGGAVIGNSFKTIFTRLQRSSTLDRLQELGVAVKDLRGETLPALTVLKQLAESYDTLGDSTKASIAEQVGGVFQINILKAALKDLSKENSLYSQATMTSSEATNEAYQKNAMLQKTLSSISAQTLTTVRELTANLGELSIAPALKDFLDVFNSAMKGISDLLGAEKGESIGSDFAQGLARAVGSVLTGPGFFGLVLIFGKLFSSALKFAKNSVKDLLQIKTIKDQELGIQESIVNAMLRNVELSEQLVKLDGNQVKQEELVLTVLRQQTKEIEQQRQIAQNIAPALRRAGVQPNLIVTGNKSQKTQNSASGLIPNYSKQPTPIEEMKEKAGAKEGGYIAGKVSTMSIPKMGRVIYNDNETVKRFKGMDQPAIMPPKSSKAGKQYGKEFAGKHGFDPYASYGLIPNFALEATKVPGTNILNLPKAKMITETTQSNFKGEVTKGWRTLEAPLDNIVKSAMSYRDEFEALKKLGVNILRRKMYFSSQKSNIKQNEMRAISRDQKKLSKSKGFASKNQHKITGNRFEGSLFNSSLQQKGYYPSWTGAYTAKGRQKGKGDENFKVDFFAPGRKPIESKYGKYTAPNLIAKSIRLYSDQYIEKFLSKHGSSGLAENMGNKKLQDSSQMLTSLGYKDVGPKEVLRAGLSGGLIPNFESQNWQNEKSSGTIDDQLKQVKDRAEALEDKKGSKNHSHYNRGFIPNFFRSFVKTKKGTINATHAYHLGSIGTGIVFKPIPGQSVKSETLVGKTAKLAPNKKTIDFDTLAEATVNSSNITRRVKGSGVAISFNTKPGNAYEKAIQASYVIKGWTGVGPANLDFTNTKWAKRDMPTANKLKTPIGGGPKNLNKYWLYADAHFGAGHGARPILEKLIRSKLVNKKMIERAMASGLLDLTASRFSKTSKFAEIIGSGGENLGYTSSKIFKPLQSNQGVNKETFGNFEGAFKEPSGFSGSNSDGAFAIKFPKDHFNHLNKPTNQSPAPQEHAIGYIPNFSAWNPLTKNTQSIAKQGGLANNKFGLAKIIQSSPFADLLRRHNHWNNFPEKHKKRLNLWLRSQGYTNRALQGWGLLSKHSKSIASGVGDLAAHHGHIPNFANPLGDAISREKEALRERGSAADIYIDQDNRLKNPKNPAGLLVANTRDEPKSGSQGVNRAISMGMDPKTHGASGGVVPNFIRNPLAPGSQGPAANMPRSTNTSNPSKQIKEAGNASEDMMMKMMGLTTVSYAFQGAMGEATESASDFHKGMGVANSAIMGLSQAMMLMMVMPKKLMPSLTNADGSRTALGGIVDRGKSNVEKYKHAASKKLGSSAVGRTALAAGGLAKGLGGMFMSVLGPLGIAIAVLIPVIGALKDQFGWFMSGTEKVSESLKSLEKGLAAIEQASQAAASMQQNQAKLYELEAIGAKRSIAQEKEYITLQGKEMKNQRTLDEGINNVVKSFTKQDASIGDSDRIQRLLSGTYKDQIKILNEMELSQRRLINLASNVKMSLESIGKAGGSNYVFSIASLDKLTPDLKNIGVDMAAALNFNFKSMDDRSVDKLTGQINNLSKSFRDAADDIEDVPLDRLKDIVRTAASSRGGDVYEDEIARTALELRNAIIGTSRELDSGGESVGRQKEGVNIALNSILDFVKLRVSSSSEPQANELNLKALTFFSEQGQQYLQSQTFLMKRQVELQEKQLSINQKTLNLANKQAGFEEVDIPAFFKLISKDEEIDRKTNLSNKDVNIRASTDKSKIQLQSESKATEVAMKLFEPDDFNKGLFGDAGFQKEHLRKLDNIISAIKGESFSGVESDSPQESGSPQLTEVQQKKLKKAEDSRSAIVNDKSSLQALLSGYGISDDQRGSLGIQQVKQIRKFKPVPEFSFSPTEKVTSDLSKQNNKEDLAKARSTIDANAKLLEPLLTAKGGMSKEEFQKAIKELKTAYKEGSISVKELSNKFKEPETEGGKGKEEKKVQPKLAPPHLRTKTSAPKTNPIKDFILNLNKENGKGEDFKGKKGPSNILTDQFENIKSVSSIEDGMRGQVNTMTSSEDQNAKETQKAAKAQAEAQNSTIEANNALNNFRNQQSDFANNRPKAAKELQEQGLLGEDQPNVQSFLNFDASQFNPSSLEGISGIPSDFKFDTNTIQNTIQTFKAFQDKIKNLLKDPERQFEYTDKNGDIQSMQAVTKEEFSAESNRMLSGKSPEENAAIIAAAIQSGLISSKSKEVKETSFELQKTSIEGKDQMTNVDKQATLDKKSNDLQAMIQKFQAKTVDGYRIAVAALVDFEAKHGPLRENLLNAQKDELQGRILNEGLRNAMLDMELKNSEELQALGMIYAASRVAAESSLTEQLNKNITDKENLKATNDSRDATEKGLRATRDSMEMEREKRRATLIEVQNKLKLSDLTEQLAADVKQESDLKISQLELDSKTLDAKRKLYENTEALQREVALQLEVQTKTKDIALQELRTSISEKGKIIDDTESPGYGMTTYQFNAQNRSEMAIDQTNDEINERRADQAFYTKQGNSLRGSEMKLQVRQLEKRQNIEQGKSGLFSDTIAVKIAETNVELERFGETLANTTFDSVTNGFKELTQTMFDGTKSMNDAMYSFFGGILQAISEKFLDRAVKQMTSGIFDLLGFDEKYSGGLIRGYASGGHTQQSPAMLTAGEYVVRKKVVDRLGVSSLDKMNKTGKVDDSLQDLYSKPNDDSVDISTTGSANIPAIQRFNEGGRLNSVISKITSPMVKFFNSGGWNNPFAANADDSATMKIAKGAGYVGGNSLAQYEQFKKQQAQDTGPVAPKAPGSTRLNTGSSLDIDPSSGMMSARFRKTDQYSQQYGQYLLDKYEHNIKQKNDRVMARANMAQSIVGNIGGGIASHGVNETITAFRGLKTATGGFTEFSNAAAKENFAEYWKKNDMVEADGDSLMLKGHGMKNLMELDHKEIKEAKKYGGYVPTMNEVKQLQKEVDAMKKHTNMMKDISKNSGESYSLPSDSNLERIKQIQTTKRSGGGRVFGPSGRDQVGPVMLDKGEYVIRASSVNSIEKQYPGFFDRINAMKFNQGGSVGDAQKTQETASPSGGNVTVNVNVSSGGQGSAEGGGGSDQAFASKIKEAVVGVISQEQRVGGTLNGK